MPTSTATGSSTQAEQQLRAQVELLKNHEAESSPGSLAEAQNGTRSAQAYSHGARSADEYDHIAAASQDAARVIASRPEADSYIHPDLRARPGQPSADIMMPIAPPTSRTPEPGPAGPSNQAIAPAPGPESPNSGDGDDMKKYRRELSQTKRAAQNRAAQRAFRQRKETYIKKLEQQVRDYMEMEQSFKTLQSENYALRDYILHLQSRMMDGMGEVPQPPPNVNLSQSGAPPPIAGIQDSVTGQPGAGTQLEAVAQAVAGLAAQEQMDERPDQYHIPPKVDGGQEDTRTADEINKQLQPEERGRS